MMLHSGLLRGDEEIFDVFVQTVGIAGLLGPLRILGLGFPGSVSRIAGF